MNVKISKDGYFKYNIMLDIELLPYSGNKDVVDMMLDYVKLSLFKQYEKDLKEYGKKD